VMPGPREALNSILSDCRQPSLLKLLMAQLIDEARKMPKNTRPSPEAQAPMVLVLKVVINELDHALRGSH